MVDQKDIENTIQLMYETVKSIEAGDSFSYFN
jgi:hypothetical protein